MINDPKVDSVAEKSKTVTSKHAEQAASPEQTPVPPAFKQQYPITFNLTSTAPFHLHDRHRYLQEQDLYKCASRDSLSSLQQLAHTPNGSTRKKYIVEDQSPYCPEDPSILTSYNHTICTNYLRPRMQFTGYQISGYKRYQVTVNLKTVDLPTKECTSLSPHLSGFLSIRGLTNQHPEISTYFEAYAVNHKELGFLSSSWEDEPVLNEYKATDQTDLEHWINFPSFRQLFLMSQQNNLNSVDDNAVTSAVRKSQPPQQLPSTPSTDAGNISRIFSQEKLFDNYLNERFIFMKWKEKFLVPDALLMEGVDGASYDGFYYIVHDQVSGNIQGFYYHQDAEKFQQLELVPSLKNKVETSDCSFEFA